MGRTREYYYSIGDEVNGLKIINQIRMKNNKSTQKG